MSNDRRYEIKYVLDEASFSSFLIWLHRESHCRVKYPQRTVHSIYFDDVNFSSVKDNLAGISDRKKTRLRWYQFEKNNQVSIPVLEQKIKEGRLGLKSSANINSLENIIYRSSFKTILELIKTDVPDDHYASLEYLVPTLSVSYLRRYYEGLNGLRITIDNKIQFRSSFSLHQMLSDRRQVAYGSRIVELKFDPSIKNQVVDLIRPLRLSPVRHSKYLTGLAMFGQVNYL